SGSRAKSPSGVIPAPAALAQARAADEAAAEAEVDAPPESDDAHGDAHAEEPAPRRPRRTALWAALALIPLGAAAAFVLVPRTRQSPADRIAAAEAAQDRATRVARLAPLTTA